MFSIAKLKTVKGEAINTTSDRCHICLFITCQQENNFCWQFFLKGKLSLVYIAINLKETRLHSHKSESIRNSTSPAALIQLTWLSSDFKGHRQTQTHTECQEQLTEVSSEQEWMKTRHKATTVSASLPCRGPLFSEQDTMGLETTLAQPAQSPGFHPQNHVNH